MLARFRRSVGSAVAAWCCLLLSLSACSLPGSGPDAEDALGDLAKAVSAGKVTGVDFAGGAADDSRRPRRTTRSPAAWASPRSSAGDVSTDGDKATGKLEWSWQVGSKTWSYDTTVDLTKGKTADGDAAGWCGGTPPSSSRR